MPGKPVKMTITELSEEFKKNNRQIAPFAWVSKEKISMPDWPPIHFPDDEDGPPSNHESDHEYPDNDDDAEEELTGGAASDVEDESLEVDEIAASGSSTSASDVEYSATESSTCDTDTLSDNESLAFSDPGSPTRSRSSSPSPIRSGAPSPSPSISDAVVPGASNTAEGGNN